MDRIRITIAVVICFFLGTSLGFAQQDSSVWHVRKTKDFILSGNGSATEWSATSWTRIAKRGKGGMDYTTDVKILYSDSGIYCLYKCSDKIITSTLSEDFADLYNEDVVEAFFWTDETVPLYFEYELSPYNYELPILVPNHKGYFLGWRPWHYEGVRKTRHAAEIQKSGDQVISWTAEFFIPYPLLKPLTNVPPHQGMRWRANFYRIDYDNKQEGSWSWKITSGNFHEYEKFGVLVFD